MGGSCGVAASWDVVCRRAAGRRRYNALRQRLRDYRRVQRACRLAGAARPRGLQARLAAELGVSAATISRDFRALPGLTLGALEPLRRWLARGAPGLAEGKEGRGRRGGA